MRKIAELPVPWLMVMDNFGNPGLFKNIYDYLPISRHGLASLIFTSRHQDVSSLGTTVFLGKLTEEEGLELFFHRLSIRVKDEFSRGRALLIINRFDRLPLTINQRTSDGTP